MAYDVTLVQVNTFVGGPSGVGLTGLPTVPWNYLLMSYWLCLPDTTTHQSGGCDLAIEFINNVSAVFNGRNYQLQLLYTPHFTVPFFDAHYLAPVSNVRVNVLVSVNCNTQTTQVYINDSPPPLISGGWVSNNRFDAGGFEILSLDVGSNLETFDTPAFADFWFNPTTSFFDLSIEANRRKFINTDLTPVYLGPSGALPGLGIPMVYLTVPSGGVPANILHNYGTGGAFSWGGSLTFQAPGTCHLPSIIQIPLTGVSATAHVGAFPQFHELKLVSLYPILPSSGDVYGLISDFGADFPASFGQFSLSVWCCEDVNIRGPNSYGTPFSFDMKFTPATATLQFYDSSNQVLFSGSFANPNKPTNLYHVMFSIDTQAQTYTFWVTGVQWTTSDAHFATIGGINNVGA